VRVSYCSSLHCDTGAEVEMPSARKTVSWGPIIAVVPSSGSPSAPRTPEGSGGGTGYKRNPLGRRAHTSSRSVNELPRKTDVAVQVFLVSRLPTGLQADQGPRLCSVCPAEQLCSCLSHRLPRPEQKTSRRHRWLAPGHRARELLIPPLHGSAVAELLACLRQLLSSSDRASL